MIRDFCALTIVVTFLGLAWHNYGGDSTDSPSEKSGLILYTDHGTGVQYVGTIFGAITVRVDRDGKPVTVK